MGSPTDGTENRAKNQRTMTNEATGITATTTNDRARARTQSSLANLQDETPRHTYQLQSHGKHDAEHITDRIEVNFSNIRSAAGQLQMQGGGARTRRVDESRRVPAAPLSTRQLSFDFHANGTAVEARIVHLMTSPTGVVRVVKTNNADPNRPVGRVGSDLSETNFADVPEAPL